MSFKPLFVTLLCTLLSFSLISQTVIVGQEIDHNSYDDLWDKFESFELFQLSASAVNNAVKVPTEDRSFQLKMGQHDWTISLFPHDVVTNDCISKLYENGDVKDLSRPEVITYSGVIEGNASSRVDLAITENMILGIINDGKQKYFIEKVHNMVEDAPVSEYILYNLSSVLPNPNISCGMDEVHKEGEKHIKNLDLPESSACYECVVGLATDAGMATKHGGTGGAQAHTIGILNLVQLNYDDEFNHEIMFQVGATFNASGTNPGAWNFSTINALLSTFGSWANGGGFGTTAYTVATLWTSRSYGGVIGLAWVRALCGGNRYNICVDYSSNTNGLRNLQAHELGHNFGLTHDPSGSPHIMAPAVNGSNTWSGQSRTQFAANVPFGCQGGCIGIAPPVPDFVGNPKTGCRPMVVQFTDLSTNSPTSWFWSFPGGTPSFSTSQNPVITYSVPGEYNVELEVSNSGGSNIAVKPFYIQVGDVPIPDFDASVVLDEVFFMDESIVYGTVDYLWDFGDGNFSNDVNPVHTYNLDGTYIVKLTLNTPCGVRTIQKSIDVVTPPTAQFRADTTQMCAGTSITFTNESSYNAETFRWKFEGGTPSTSIEENPRVFYDQAGVYEVELFVSNTRYQDIEKKVGYIVVDEQAIAAFTETINPTTLAVNFMTQTPNGRTHKWNFGDGSTSMTKNPSHTYTLDSTYDVTLIVGNYCGDDTITQTIVVGRLPEADFLSDQTEGCVPFIVNFEDRSSLNTTRRLWKFEGGDPATSTEVSPSVLYDSEGEYKVTLIAVNGLGKDTMVVDQYITVTDEPTSDFDFLRNGYVIDFENLSDGATSYFWQFGDGETSMEENPEHTYPGDGNYKVILIVSNICGDDTLEREVNISNLPNANFTADSREGCAPMTVTLTNQSSPNTESVEWLIPGGSPSTSFDENPVVQFNNPGLYRVTLIAKNTFGNDTVVKQDYIEVLDVPEADFTYMLSGFDAEFNADTKYGRDYFWDFGDGETSTLENPAHLYGEEGTFKVILIVSNICGDDTVEYDIVVTPKPIVDFDSDTREVCVGETVYFEDLSSNNPTSWAWTFDGGDPATSDEQNPAVVYNTPGRYRVVLQATNQFGTNESEIDEYITVFDDPVAKFTTKDGVITAEFVNESEQYGIFHWEFGDGETSDEFEPVHRYKYPGKYTITLTVTNACGVDVYEYEFLARYNGIDMIDIPIPPSPNPTDGRVRVRHSGDASPTISVLIGGLNGQVEEVYQGDFTTGVLDQMLDLSHLNEGTYMMFFKTNDEVRMTKVVIQK